LNCIPGVLKSFALTVRSRVSNSIPDSTMNSDLKFRVYETIMKVC
jgi:hypothetical protein